MQTSDDPVRVVVVGAGLAGLACAKKLQDDGSGRFSVIVLEARERPGGRVRTQRSSGMVVDMGGSWVHGLKGNPMASMLSISQENRGFVRCDYRTLVRYDAAEPIPHAEMVEANELFKLLLQRYEESLPDLVSHLESDSAETVLSQVFEEMIRESGAHPFGELPTDPEARAEQVRRRKVCLNYLISDLESVNNSPLDEISATYLLEDDDYAGGDHHIVAGAEDVVLPALCGSGGSLLREVRTQQVVRQVSHRGDEPIKLVVEDLSAEQNSHSRFQEVECDVVVLTVPIGVLRTDIDFIPPLPIKKLEAMEAVGYGSYNKVALRWNKEDVFWPDAAHILSFNFPMIQDAEHGNDWRLQADSKDTDANSLMRLRHNMWVMNHLPVDGQPMLVFMISGRLAAEMQEMSSARVVERVLAAVRVPFPNAPRPIGVAVGRWDLNEFTRGGWSYHKPGWRGLEHINALIAPLRGVARTHIAGSEDNAAHSRVLFAGEATSESRPGYMDGAIESGWREAQRLLSEYTGKTLPAARL